MCKNRGSYDEVRVDIIQPIRERTEDRLVRIRMEEFIDGLLPEPDRAVSKIERGYAPSTWIDDEDPELPAPPRPNWA